MNKTRVWKVVKGTTLWASVLVLLAVYVYFGGMVYHWAKYGFVVYFPSLNTLLLLIIYILGTAPLFLVGWLVGRFFGKMSGYKEGIVDQVRVQLKGIQK